MELAARVGLTRSVYGTLVDDQLRRGAVPPRPLGHRGSAADAGGGQRARAPLREPAYSIIAPGSPRWPVATRPPRRTSKRHGAWWRERRGDQYSFARAIAVARWRERSATAARAREEVRRALAHETHRAGAALRLAARLARACGSRPRRPSPRPSRWRRSLAMAGDLPATTPPALAYRALADAEVARGAGLGRR